jgi:hypothetical protein
MVKNVELTLGEIVEAVEASGLVEDMQPAPPVKVSYWISRNIINLRDAADLFYEKRNEIVKELGEEAKFGYRIPKDDGEALALYQEQVNELVEIEEEVQIRLIELGELGAAKLAPRVFRLFDFMFVEGAEDG